MLNVWWLATSLELKLTESDAFNSAEIIFYYEIDIGWAEHFKFYLCKIVLKSLLKRCVGEKYIVADNHFFNWNVFFIARIFKVEHFVGCCWDKLSGVTIQLSSRLLCENGGSPRHDFFSSYQSSEDFFFVLRHYWQPFMASNKSSQDHRPTQSFRFHIVNHK